MASKTTLNATNLEALGTQRLAQLLLDISTGDAHAKRRLRMELAGIESPSKLIHEIRKRLTAIGGTTTFIGWRSLKGFKTDLQVQRRLIAEQVAGASPTDALELMWQFMALSTGVLERTTDTSGEAIAIFRQACDDIGQIASQAGPNAADLAARVADAVVGNTYGQNDRLVEVLAPALGRDGLVLLRALLLAPGVAADSISPLRGRRTSRWRRGRKMERDTVRRQTRGQMIQKALADIADALGDVDAWIDLQTEPGLPDVAARIAERLLRADRAAEALAVLDKVSTRSRAPQPLEWQGARIAALEALGRGDEAQTFRLDSFRSSLNGDFLRAYLRRLPDFDDIEAEDTALDFAMTFGDVHAALAFLVAWPALERAARLIAQRGGEIDGYEDERLVAAADKLEARYPLAATLLLRKMIDTVLVNSQTIDYPTAAGHLQTCARLAPRIDDFGGFEDHDAYLTRLRASHGRKTAFWSEVD